MTENPDEDHNQQEARRGSGAGSGRGGDYGARELGPDGEPIVRASGLEPGMAFEVQFAHDQRRGAVATGEPVAGVAPAAAGEPEEA